MAEILSDEKKWELVRATVQGQPSVASCTFADGRIAFSPAPILRGAEQNLALLAQILRSKEPLPPIAREWLADLFDPAGRSDYRVKSLSRRVRGAAPVGEFQHWDAAQYALELIGWRESDAELAARGQSREKWAVAVKLTAQRYRISETAVEDAMRSYREAADAHDSIR